MTAPYSSRLEYKEYELVGENAYGDTCVMQVLASARPLATTLIN
jgi:hypothetical protein